jgi:hypothetical protein
MHLVSGAVDLGVREESHEDGKFAFDASRRGAFGCDLDITGYGSSEELCGGTRWGDGQVSFRNQKALSGKLQGLGQRSEFLVPELRA